MSELEKKNFDEVIQELESRIRKIEIDILNIKDALRWISDIAKIK